jgi:hypothetical protein
LSLASQASSSSSGGQPVQQPLQPLYLHDWQYSDPDGSLTFSNLGLEGLVTGREQTIEDSSPPELPITPVRSCAFDDGLAMHGGAPWSGDRILAITPTYDINTLERVCIPTTQWTGDVQDTTDIVFTSPTCGNASPYPSRQDPFDPGIFYTPTHIPTILIEHWFSDVCPMWNIFDSDSNFNRQFASSSWSSSEPVFYAIQSMSAACLVDTLPVMMPVLSSLTSKALAAIRSRVSFFEDAQRTVLPEFPADLLFAVFAMGTSLHWKHGFELGGSLMKYAHCVIDRYKNRLPAMAPSERHHRAFFQKALICWEGILSAADSNFTPASFVVRRQAYQRRVAPSQFQMPSPQPQFGPLNYILGVAYPAMCYRSLAR